jgi:hypothetical protein
MPIVVFGQLLVSLVFAELGSRYPIAGALFHFSVHPHRRPPELTRTPPAPPAGTAATSP